MTNQYDLNTASAIGVVEQGLVVISGTYSSYLVNTANDNATILVNKNLDF